MRAYIKNGLWGKSKKISKGDLDLRRYVRDVVASLGVAVSDSCCTGFQEGTAPMRYNTDTSEMEYYDAGDKQWKSVPSAEG